MFSYLVEAFALGTAWDGAEAYLAGPVIPPGVDVNELPKEEQRALIRAEMNRQRGRQTRAGG